MTLDQILHVQKRIGTTVDGWWGPKSTAKCQEYLRAMMPHPHPFPKQSRVEDFYGPHGVSGGFEPPRKEIKLPFPIYYTDDNGVSVIWKLRPHEKCADSLLRVFERLDAAFPTDADKRIAGILNYDGLYNPRPMRGGSAWSMHSWAIAIDLDAAVNGNTQHWPTSAMMPLEVMECFAREGWTSAGAFWSRDAMHFQALAPN